MRVPFLMLVAFSSFSFADSGVVIPGTGQRYVINDFSGKLEFVKNGPKATREQTGQQKYNPGYSIETYKDKNGREYTVTGNMMESDLRGYPDKVERICLAPNVYALKLQTKDADIRGKGAMLDPNPETNRVPQDDLIFRTPQKRTPEEEPSYVMTIYAPDMKYWENREGSSFGFRVSAMSEPHDKETRNRKGKVIRTDVVAEPFWPGIFILRQKHPITGKDVGVFEIRANENGKEVMIGNKQNVNGREVIVPSLKIEKAGWWKLGISFSKDRRVHYFIKEGNGPFTMKDHVGSYMPYRDNGFVTETLSTTFVNICSDGENWSTPWTVGSVVQYVNNPGAMHSRTNGYYGRVHVAPPVNGDSRR